MARPTLSGVDRLERLTDLVLVLLSPGPPRSLAEIADAVPGYPPAGEARRQAFERDKRTLRDQGIVVTTEPLRGPEQVGYRIRPEDFYLPDLELTPDEQVALNLAVAAVHVGDGTGEQALWRLGLPGVPPPGATMTRPPAGGGSEAEAAGGGAADPGGATGPGSAAPRMVVPPVVATLPGLDALPTLYEAIRSRAEVRFEHRGETRRVVPTQLRFQRGRWYLDAHDLDRAAPRTFRVDRITGRPDVGEPGSGHRPVGADDADVWSGDPWQAGDDPPVLVDVLVDAVVVGRVVADVGEDRVVERRADGSVVVRLEVTNMTALRTWVLDLGVHAEVLAPSSARAEVVAWLETTVAVR